MLVSDISDATVFADRVRGDFEKSSALGENGSLRQVEVDSRIDEMFNWPHFATSSIGYQELMKWQESESEITRLYNNYLDDAERYEWIKNWEPKKSFLRRLCDRLSR